MRYCGRKVPMDQEWSLQQQWTAQATHEHAWCVMQALCTEFLSLQAIHLEEKPEVST